MRGGAAVGAGLVFLQSVLGGLMRHMDAGMACPDAPLCLGQVVPPPVNAPIAVHFSHRVLGILVALAVCVLAYRLHRSTLPFRIRRWGPVAAALVLTQVGLGFASVLTVLAVVPVSLHTLVAASLLAALVHVATVGEPAPAPRARLAPAPAA
jgi:heme A synthase